MLDAGERTGGLAAFYPRSDAGADPRRVITEGTGLEDRVVGLRVEVGHGGEDPVDADAQCIACRGCARSPNCIEITQRTQRARRRQLLQPRKLLAGTALEIGSKEKRTRGTGRETRREAPHRFSRPAEDDEAGDTKFQRLVNQRRLMLEARVALPAKRRHQEPRQRRCHGTGHGRVTEPSTRRPAAPVAAGRFPGWPWMVRCPSSAKAAASFASPSKNSSSNFRIETGAPRPCSIRRASAAITPGWWAPPPETTISAAGVQRPSASAIVRAVSSTAVATASA